MSVRVNEHESEIDDSLELRERVHVREGVVADNDCGCEQNTLQLIATLFLDPNFHRLFNLSFFEL